MAETNPGRDIARYPDLSYRDVFWAQRAYEDRADRLALRALLPTRGERLLEVGAGYGRLLDEYGGWRWVTLVDTSEAHVAAAREAVRESMGRRVELGDAYHLPFEDASFDALVCVRVLHHLEDPDAAFAEFARVLAPGGVLVVEFANKRHLKAVVRHLLGRGEGWDPSSREPYAWKPLHIVRHPDDVRRRLVAAGFRVERTLTASLFRWPRISRHVPLALLSAVERPLQARLAALAPGPSVWVLGRRMR